MTQQLEFQPRNLTLREQAHSTFDATGTSHISNIADAHICVNCLTNLCQASIDITTRICYFQYGPVLLLTHERRSHHQQRLHLRRQRGLLPRFIHWQRCLVPTPFFNNSARPRSQSATAHFCQQRRPNRHDHNNDNDNDHDRRRRRRKQQLTDNIATSTHQQHLKQARPPRRHRPRLIIRWRSFHLRQHRHTGHPCAQHHARLQPPPTKHPH